MVYLGGECPFLICNADARLEDVEAVAERCHFWCIVTLHLAEAVCFVGEFWWNVGVDNSFTELISYAEVGRSRLTHHFIHWLSDSSFHPVYCGTYEI